MTYDLEKYREKREKVLGVKKRGIGFGTIACIFSVVIVLGLGFVVIPKSVAFFSSLYLDDVIFKKTNGQWPEDILAEIKIMKGVKEVITNKDSSRLVITFDRTVTDSAPISDFFKNKGLDTVLLNRVGHRERMTLLQKEGDR